MEWVDEDELVMYKRHEVLSSHGSVISGAATKEGRYVDAGDWFICGVPTLVCPDHGRIRRYLSHYPFGKILGSIVAILGVGMFALPTGILGSGFIEDIQNKQKKTFFARTVEKTLMDNQRNYLMSNK